MIRQEHKFFESEEQQLFGAIYHPQCENKQSIGFVICSPFAEEIKSSKRMMVDLAKQMAETGYTVFLFDYFACGDSDGDFKDATLSIWIKNTWDAIKYLKQHTDVKSIGLIGLRLGCFIALSVINECEDITKSILIEPVFDPETYFKRSLRQKLMKELITDGQTKSRRNDLIDQLNNNKSIDFDGYEISSSFYSNLLIHKNQIPDLLSVDIDLVLIHITPTGRISRDFQKIIEAGSENKRLSFKKIQLDPFWERIDNPIYQPAIDEVLNTSLSDAKVDYSLLNK